MRITALQFHESEGVDDWRVLAFGACAHFVTGSFSTGVALVGAIGALAGQVGKDPDVDLRPGHVTVRLLTLEQSGLTEADRELAVLISRAARELGVSADPSAVSDVQFAIDVMDLAKVRPFWAAVLGYEEWGEEDVIDPRLRMPSIWFQEMDEPRTQRNRIHIDVFVPHDQAEARVAAAVAAGGRVLYDAQAPTWWTLADPEGNEVDVATWLGRDGF
ncbi:VOC family protein [Nonomuraea soli]|uniref:Putative pterin-4-alpha-carbinolamine dehydratase n=1 Tax=Nonomuraea soli TaxID=1032476 RepID=A0A7W0HUW1_9ACTN|nr:VOC family protein [Nonomuraea soli]MBA2896515.1 4a-hydroxytetrahydrobiopterin dehydratase [Nonomuraea soli]